MHNHSINTIAFQDDRDDLGLIFIHSELDDFGLSPWQFRVYARIARRASAGKTECYESIKNIADGCQMSESKVKSSLDFLLECGLVIKESHPGHPSTYKLSPRRNWIRPTTSQKNKRGGHQTPKVDTKNHPPHNKPTTPPITNLPTPPITNLPTPPITNPLSKYIKDNTKEVNTVSESAFAHDPHSQLTAVCPMEKNYIVITHAPEISTYTEIAPPTKSKHDATPVTPTTPVQAGGASLGNQDINHPPSYAPESSIRQLSPSSEKGGKLNNRISTADRVRTAWESAGVLPKIPMEFEEWAKEDLGSDVIAQYRKSGRITTIKTGDINANFAIYVSGQNKGKDIDYGYSYIKKLEKSPEQWETLRALVLKWKVSQQTNDSNLNVATQATRKPDRVRRNFNFTA
jgi:DNA-binding MarR family transcriptional regulator